MSPKRVSHILLVVALIAGLACTAALATVAAPRAARAASATPGSTPAAAPASLAALVTDPNPWLHLEANSEQRSPIYMGSTPRELALGLPPVDGGVARLPQSLKTLGGTQIMSVRQSLVRRKAVPSKQAFQLELWPMRDDRGRFTWAFARWRLRASNPWLWLRAGDVQNMDPGAFVPKPLDPSAPSDYAAIFGDPSSDPYGYDITPVFGDCIWLAHNSNPDVAVPIEAWLPTSMRASYATRPDLSSRTALVLPQPARLNGVPVTYVVTVGQWIIDWPSSISWTADPATPGAEEGSAVIGSWPADLASAYRADLLALDGEEPALFPLSGAVSTFAIKNNAQADNQLEQLFGYLEERYAVLGVRTWRQSFSWRGMPQANLVAEIPGSDSSLAPVVMADHVDTAFDEDLARKGIWVSVPGADDNCSATAALLRAAAVLKDRRPQRTIWLVHFTGEEFPADDLGCRQLVSGLLGDRREIAGIVLLDMIGYSGKGVLYQLNPGTGAAAARMASVALDASADQSPELRPQLETRYSERSYLYNTDGIILSENGYPVLLINERMNYFSGLMRAGYHDMGDTSELVNFAYAVRITKVAIETVARLSGVPAR